jgi:hypothetical protein
MPRYRNIAVILLLFVAAYALRLAFGLWCEPVQPVIDEIQTYLVGLKFYATGAWPFYGNDVVAPPENLALLTQDPGALEGLLIGLPLFLWPHPLAPFLLLNLISLGALGFLAWYAVKRLPALSPWFVFPWVLLAPWCVHYTTGVVNLSYSMAAACFFFPAFLESLPNVSLNWLRRPWANALMGFSFAFWLQFHRTWVLALPFLAVSFYLQWRQGTTLRVATWAGDGTTPKYTARPLDNPGALAAGETRKVSPPLIFSLGALPLLGLVIPTFFRGDYRFFRDVSGMSAGFNPANIAELPRTLGEYLSLACFQLPRFIGGHTDERLRFLTDHGLIAPGIFLWGFGILQAVILLVYFFDSRNPRPDWKPIRLFAALSFLLVSVSLLFTVKKPDVNLYCEFLPVMMLYSLYVWERWWALPKARTFLWLFLACALIFQASYPFTQLPVRKSFYLKYHDAIQKALDAKDYRLLAERRKGSLY